jgi:hypothetical protein
MVDLRNAAVWQLILRLLGRESKAGPAPSLPSLPPESKTNSAPESSVSVASKKKESPAIEKLVEIALSQVGVKEVGGNNKGLKIREYQSATSLKPAAWPWCAALISWIIREWLKDPEVVKWLNLKVLTPEKWRPKTAAAFGYIEWAKSRPATTKVFSEKAKPQVGDLVIFDFSHIGIVVKVGENNFQCVEGNTNQRGTRDSNSGDGVWLKTRTPSLVRNYIRINPSKVQ